MDAFLRYFRQVVTDPANAEPWSQWWATHEGEIQQTLPLVEYVRLKHRRVRGAREILQRAGELPLDFQPPEALRSGVCAECGETVTRADEAQSNAGAICPRCGPLGTADLGASQSDSD